MINKNDKKYIKSPKTGRMDKSKCEGCSEDFYNGKNPHNIKKCMYLDSATLVLRKKVPLDQKPPWNQEPILVPSNLFL